MNNELQTKLNKLFDALEAEGYFARQDFMCCQSCACYEIPEDKGSKYVFYHQQDTENAIESNSLHLAWAGNGKEIVRLAEEAGLIVEWEGTEAKRIGVSI